MKANALYYGDNLVWLKNHDRFPDESIDLIYLDPPFNSNADYNIIFNEPSGEESQAQLRAFGDTWGWDKEPSASAIEELNITRPEIAEFIGWLGRKGDKSSESTAAYLGMMATRLIELHRVLKPTGSIYLHCDSTASHYLKVLMDNIFGTKGFGNEIIWRRTNAKGLAFTRFASNHDVILRYTKSEKAVWNPQYTEHDPEYVDKFYRYVEPDTGRRYRLADLTNPNRNRPNLTYEFLGITRVWRWTKERMQDAYDKGVIVQAQPGRVPALKRYLDEQEGTPVDDIWDDISPIQPHSKERLGYPTQKPEALLERIVQASSNEEDVLLDPFCGCGTALVTAQKLKRRWIGIDITYLSIDLVEQRLIDSFGQAVKDTYEIYGNPYDVPSAQALWNKNTKEFELWAIRLIGATPRPKDGGVDGVMGFMDKDGRTQKIVVQVKGGETLIPGFVRDLIGTAEKEKAAIGLLICLHPPTAGMVELAVHSRPFKSELWQKPYPSIQIRTIQELLMEGKQFDLPPQVSGLKRAERIREQGQTKQLL